jgi:alpha-tubulin suppressor-like RCC1 family protein
VKAIATGLFHTCALTVDGRVKCWGWNRYGEVGDGTVTQRTSPVDVIGLASDVSAISTGDYFTCALTKAGVKCWGYNTWGQLGDGTRTKRPTPVDVSGLTSGVSALATGEGHACALINSGAVKCWGLNSSGQLGDATRETSPTPTKVRLGHVVVTAIGAGSYHTCALTNSGGVKCWGSNNTGQLGIPND